MRRYDYELTSNPEGCVSYIRAFFTALKSIHPLKKLELRHLEIIGEGCKDLLSELILEKPLTDLILVNVQLGHFQSSLTSVIPTVLGCIVRNPRRSLTRVSLSDFCQVQVHHLLIEAMVRCTHITDWHVAVFSLPYVRCANWVTPSHNFDHITTLSIGNGYGTEGGLTSLFGCDVVWKIRVLTLDSQTFMTSRKLNIVKKAIVSSNLPLLEEIKFLSKLHPEDALSFLQETVYSEGGKNLRSIKFSVFFSVSNLTPREAGFLNALELCALKILIEKKNVVCLHYNNYSVWGRDLQTDEGSLYHTILNLMRRNELIGLSLFSIIARTHPLKTL